MAAWMSLHPWIVLLVDSLVSVMFGAELGIHLQYLLTKELPFNTSKTPTESTQ